MCRHLLISVAPVVALLVAPIASPAHAAPAETSATAAPLGRLEQESVDESLAALGLRIDPAPQGKVVGRIYVVSHEVFSRRDWHFQLLNVFHRTTRPDILLRELLIAPGALYDLALLEESTRNLQSPPSFSVGGRPFEQPELSSVVVIVPVVSPRPGTVDLLAVTRDVWSLRLNTNFEFQQNTLSFLATSLSENNLFGWRKYLSVGLTMDQGAIAVGPTYFDPNIAGTRLTLLASATPLFTRATRQHEGDIETFSLRYPLFALASRWGAGVDVLHQDAVIRSFRGNVLRVVDVTTADGVVPLPYIYRRRILSVDSSVVRSFRRGDVIQRLTAGHALDGRSSSAGPDFPDPAHAPDFLAQLAPISERRSEPYLQYDLFTARYTVLRDLDTFDLRENRQLGPSLSLRVAAGLPELGADFRAFPTAAAAGWALAPGGGYGSVSVAVGARWRDGHAIDQSLSGGVSLASPMLGRRMRIVSSAKISAVRADTRHNFFALGGDNGLRGYAIGDFRGTSVAVAHVELRSAPLPIYSQRFGALVFYDVGDAGPSLTRLFARHDLGLGLRWLIPQLNASVIRFDWAVATQSTDFTRAGLPGRFSAGFEQVF